MKLTYNGYEIETNKSILKIEMINYGYIEDNFSEVIVRRYTKELEFIKEIKFYKNSEGFNNHVRAYLSLRNKIKI